MYKASKKRIPKYGMRYIRYGIKTILGNISADNIV